jgi:hypothetical protein
MCNNIEIIATTILCLSTIALTCIVAKDNFTMSFQAFGIETQISAS